MSEQVKDYPPYLDYPKPRKKQTNADRIRAMTDEELASMCNSHKCGFDCPVGEFDKHKCYTHESCYHCWLDWMKQEVENDG